MINKIVPLLIILALLSFRSYPQSTPFNKGINLTNWFQTNSASQIQFTKYTKVDFEDIKSLGVDVIRLPINLHSMVTNTNDYELDPLFLTFLDHVADWSEELDLHLILDNHTFNPSVSTDPAIKDILIPIWKNMAMHFKNRSNLIYFEILNEPHGISDEIWNNIQGEVISAIREIDTVHTLIVGPSGYNSFHNLNSMPAYEDDKLIYTFHFYDPFIFTHQGASWTDPSMVLLGDVPFPYNQSEMPDVPSDLIGTWIHSSLNNYSNEGTIAKVRELLNIAAEFKTERGVPLFCGEFGVLMNNAENNDRILWYNIVRTYLEYKGISWTTWDYHGGFGLFNQFGNDLFDHDLNVKLLESLGFNTPPQSELIINPDTVGFSFYSDFIESRITESSNTNGSLNFYSEESKLGDFCIHWFNPSQYNSIGFKFQPIRDLSFLAAEDYVLGFWFKGDESSAKFELRFIDTKTSSEDHPWRRGYTLDFANAVFDSEWHHIKIPLSSFSEYGSWDNDTWYNPIGLFDWSSVDRFEIVDEHGKLSNVNLWFDEIRLYDESITDVRDEDIFTNYELSQNYPNPFNPSTIINVFIPVDGKIELKIFNIIGVEVAQLENGFKTAGRYSYNFDASKYASGVYYYQFKFENNIETKKMLLLK